MTPKLFVRDLQKLCEFFPTFYLYFLANYQDEVEVFDVGNIGKMIAPSEDYDFVMSYLEINGFTIKKLDRLIYSVSIEC